MTERFKFPFKNPDLTKSNSKSEKLKNSSPGLEQENAYERREIHPNESIHSAGKAHHRGKDHEIPSVPVELVVISVQGPSFWAVTQPPDVHKDPETSFGMFQVQWYAGFGIPIQPVDPGRDQEYPFDQHVSGVIQAIGACIPLQQRKIIK
ncbi:hypothetical protein AYI68_g7153 [Smittium mucronatum]|uniref:Uncharacterized protein n=1 Tax=Smittium mucronatum TaxID=133383 RepID=A0A1R0GPJ5_9FUNG|nr:hypothetical protein AYI68_g7153 [Smittium mucronatum]